jgi:hypothetical protein
MLQTSLFTHMMGDLGLVACAGGGQGWCLVVECFKYFGVSCIFDKGQSQV